MKREDFSGWLSVYQFSLIPVFPNLFFFVNSGFFRNYLFGRQRGFCLEGYRLLRSLNLFVYLLRWVVGFFFFPPRLNFIFFSSAEGVKFSFFRIHSLLNLLICLSNTNFGKILSKGEIQIYFAAQVVKRVNRFFFFFFLPACYFWKWKFPILT